MQVRFKQCWGCTIKIVIQHPKAWPKPIPSPSKPRGAHAKPIPVILLPQPKQYRHRVEPESAPAMKLCFTKRLKPFLNMCRCFANMGNQRKPSMLTPRSKNPSLPTQLPKGAQRKRHLTFSRHHNFSVERIDGGHVEAPALCRHQKQPTALPSSYWSHDRGSQNLAETSAYQVTS